MIFAFPKKIVKKFACPQKFIYLNKNGSTYLSGKDLQYGISILFASWVWNWVKPWQKNHTLLSITTVPLTH
jgi:hypothetical protein